MRTKQLIGLFFVFAFQINAFSQIAFTLKGKILDAKNQQPLLAATISVKGKPSGAATELDGSFKYDIFKKYLQDTLVVAMLGYESLEISIKNAKAKADSAGTLTFLLQETAFDLVMPVVGASIILKNIEFEFNKHTLLASSFTELEKLYNYLKKNETIEVEIAGHTDSSGDEDYNLALSEARASAVVAYLEEKGIAQERLNAKGYGESKPIASNDTEEGMAINRRVEFTILKIEEDGIVIRENNKPKLEKKEKKKENETEQLVENKDTTFVVKKEKPAPKPTTEPTVIVNTTSLKMQLDSIVTAYTLKGNFNGNVLVAKNGTTLFEGNKGFANISWTAPNTLNTKFNIGAITEQFTAALVLLQVQAGRLQLDDPVKQHLPEFATLAGNRITIHHLLNHTSGLDDEITTNLQNIELLYVPGTSYQYSVLNYYLLGKILEITTGKKYGDLLQTTILIPFQLNNTRFANPALVDKSKASGYQKVGNKFENVVPQDLSTTAAANGLVSTIGDLLKWQRVLQNHQLLDAATYQLLLKPDLSNRGYGIHIEQIMVGATAQSVAIASGKGNGFEALMMHATETDNVLILLGNVENTELQKVGRVLLKRVLSVSAP